MKLHDSLTQNHSIRPQTETGTWREAVKIGVDLLAAVDVAKPRYYQVILDGVTQHGPYFVTTPGLVMSHRRPEEGTKKTDFASAMPKRLLISGHEDNDSVDILIAIVAVDVTTHQEVNIMQIVSLFGDEANFDCLRTCCSEQEVLDLIRNAAAAAA